MPESHVPGHTTETPTRPPQDYTAPVHVHKLEDEGAQLIEEARSNPSRRAARTLSKDAALSAVVMAIQGGAVVQDHSVHGSAVLQVLQGHLKVSLEDREVELNAAEAISFASHVPHTLTAVEDTALLLVLTGS